MLTKEEKEREKETLQNWLRVRWIAFGNYPFLAFSFLRHDFTMPVQCKRKKKQFHRQIIANNHWNWTWTMMDRTWNYLFLPFARFYTTTTATIIYIYGAISFFYKKEKYSLANNRNWKLKIGYINIWYISSLYIYFSPPPWIRFFVSPRVTFSSSSPYPYTRGDTHTRACTHRVDAAIQQMRWD